MAAGQPEAERALRALNDTFVRHFNAGNADQLVQVFYAEDARLLPPNHPTVSGRSGSAIRSRLSSMRVLVS